MIDKEKIKNDDRHLVELKVFVPRSCLLWLKENKFSVTRICMEAVKELGYKEDKNGTVQP